MKTLGPAWPAEEIWESVEPGLPGFTVEVLPEVDSTNSELMRRARAGLTDPTLLVAERQTAGRGRLGRNWLSGVDPLQQSQALLPSLTFSLGLPLQRHDWSGLSLAVGLSVLTSLRQAAGLADTSGLGLKWPNDLWCQGKKLGGILIETQGQETPRYAVIGIGINILAPGPVGDAALSVPPVGLRALWPAADAGQALLWAVPALVQAVQRFDLEGFAPFQALYGGVDLLQDQAVRLSDGSQGVARGVDLDGGLRVQTADGMRHVTSGEISVRPVGAAPAD